MKPIHLVALLGNLLELAFGAPLSYARDVQRLQSLPRVQDFSISLLERRGETDITSRLQDYYYPERLIRLKVRAQEEKPKPSAPPPPPPPPPPLPPPSKKPTSNPKQNPKPKVQVKPNPRPQSPPRPSPPSPKSGWKPIPSTEKPGQGQGIGDVETKAMDVYAASGEEQQRAYELKIKSGTPDTPIVKKEVDLAPYGPNEAFLDIRQNSLYEMHKSTVNLLELKELKLFKSSELGFDIRSPRQVVQLAVNPKRQLSVLINRGTYDPDGQFVVWQDEFKLNNQVKKPLPLNEMSIQNFIGVAGDKTKNLQAALISNIQNKQFWDITRQNYNDKKQPFSQVLTFERGTPQFNRYMVGPIIYSKFFSFANHHNAIGNKKPQKIIIVPRQAENSGNMVTAALVFG